jgi:hypothetical protein
MSIPNIQGRRDISLRIATGWTAGVRFSTEERNFSLPHSIKVGSGANGYWWALSPGIKWLECEADYSRLSSDQVKNCGAIPPLPYTPPWAGA